MEVLLSVQNVTKEFSSVRLFQPVSFIVRKKDKTAILGPNGTGKSTLLKMILGKEEVTSGNIIFSKNVTVGYLSQDVIENENNTLYEEVMNIFTPLIQQEEKLNSLSLELEKDPNNTSLLDEYSKLQSDFELKGGYNFKYRISTFLNMFSFSKEDYNRKIITFSGGEKTRLCFAKLLLINPDILILDEPTNHLDIISVEWLEEYLAQYQGALLFVSHDIAFIKHIANHILDIDNKVITTYNTDYDNFSKMKKDNYENALAQFKSQEAERARLERFITFYMPKPRFASRAKDRVKKLERLENNAISDPSKKETRNLSMSLSGNIREGKRLLEFTNVSIGFSTPLISNIDFTLFGKDHLAIMGANGIGKSTFGKVLLNELKPLTGEIRKYFHMSMGVLRQDIRSYSSDETLFNHFRSLYPRMSNQEIYNALARYAFSYQESNEKRLCDLSGGELMRIEILQLSLQDYDLLLLDEPTNHLDMLSISELIDALNNYEGTLVIISHDRDFIDKTCNKLLYFYNKTSYYYEGSYNEFKENRLVKIIQEEKEKIEEENLKKKEEEKKIRLEKKEKYNENKKTRLTRTPPEKILEKIDKLEKKKKEVVDSCYLEENYSDTNKMKQIENELKELEKNINSLYEELNLSMN